MALADSSSSSSSSSLMDSPKIFKTCPLLFSAVPHLPFFPSPPSSPRHHLLSTAMDRLLHKLSDSLSQAPKTFFRALLSPFSDSQRHVFPRIRFRQSVDPGPLSAHNFAAILPGDTAAGVVVANGILNFLNIYSSLLVVRLVLTWFPNAPPAIVSPLSTLCDPYLNIFRGIIPPLGGTLDFSPILAFLVLNAFTSAAAALPAELPASGRSQLPVSQSNLFNLKATQAKWMRRVSRKGPKEIDESN